MWSNIGNIGAHRSSIEFLPFGRRRDSMSSTDDVDSTTDETAKLTNNAQFLYADCHGTNKGLFAGLLGARIKKA